MQLHLLALFLILLSVVGSIKLISKRKIIFSYINIIVIFTLISVNSFADLHHNHTSINEQHNDCPVTILKSNPLDFGTFYTLPEKQTVVINKNIITDFICDYAPFYQLISSRAPPFN